MMKKFLLTLLFNLFFSLPTFAQEIASANYDEHIAGGIKSMDKCWECKLVEGVYTYTFNFVFKMYKILAPIIQSIVLVFLAFWFLWIVWDKVIRAHMNFKGGNVFDFLKEDIWKKLFTVLFVITLLAKVPANEMFSYTIDPIMSFGAGFGKWILVETRNDNEIMQNYSNAITKKSLPKYDCSDIKLSANTVNMLNVNNVNASVDMNTATLKNLICITGEYANSYTIGLNLGAKIFSRGMIGVVGAYSGEKITKGIDSIASMIPSVGWAKVVQVIIKIILVVLKVLFFVGVIINFFIAVIGLFIMIQFMYVGLTFITLILDIVIQLALVGVMLPIVIGSWAFADKGFMNLRGKLSGKLFWNVLTCSFRLAFLAISMSISIFLLNELMTTSFDSYSGETMLSLYDSLGSSKNLWNQGTGLNKETRDFLYLIISNTGLLIAMVFTTLISWMLLRQSIQKADELSGQLYSGFSDANILAGLQKLTETSIKYVFGGAKREVDFYKKMSGAKQELKKEIENNAEKTRKLKIKEWENEVLNEGDDTHIFDIPAETVVNAFDAIRNNEQDDIEETETKTEAPIGPKTKEESENPIKLENAPLAPNIRKNEEEVKKLQQPAREFVESQIISPEYKDLPEKEKQEMATVILSNNPEELKNFSNKPEISQMFETINATPKEDDEIVNDKFITDNLVATDIQTPDDLSNPMVKMQAVYIREKVIEEINTLPPQERAAIKSFMNLTKKPNLSNPEKKRKFEEQKKIYEKLESKVKSDMLMKQKEIKELISERENLQKHNKVKSILTTRKVIEVIKNDELNDLIKEIDNTDFTDVIKRSYLNRQLKNLESEIDALKEKDSLELEDEYDSIVANWRIKKMKRKSKINPDKR